MTTQTMGERGSEPCSIVAPETFVLATRHTGYRDISSALAELVDNSLQAESTRVDIFVREVDQHLNRSILVGVLDNGLGMTASALQTALQFGGTSRFDDRSGLGRFGMGLPNSSVSQTRRLEVYSWQHGGRALHTYLDVDEVASGRLHTIPTPQPRRLPEWVPKSVAPSGTLVLWTRCDRLERSRPSTIADRLIRTLGRIYRFHLSPRLQVSVNGARVSAIDPLFLDPLGEVHGARAFGLPLRYEVATGTDQSSVVEVRFTELPVRRWYSWSVEDKRRAGIVGRGGVSIVRAGREIDYGWHLMGHKRRENYDDWWRCEIQFSPTLDEMFGVTHSKQGINPSAELKALLEPDLEHVARVLNGRVRRAFRQAKPVPERPAVRAASKADRFLPIPPSLAGRRRGIRGLRYHLQTQPIAGPEFYGVRVKGDVVIVTVNSDHPFFAEGYKRLSEPARANGRDVVERLLLAAARADLEACNSDERRCVSRLRRAWSDALAAFVDVR